jgi:uncharacterized protein YukE
MTGFTVDVEALKAASEGVRGNTTQLQNALTTLSAGDVTSNSFGLVGLMIGTHSLYTTRLQGAQKEISDAISYCDGIADRLKQMADSYNETEGQHDKMFREI